MSDPENLKSLKIYMLIIMLLGTCIFRRHSVGWIVYVGKFGLLIKPFKSVMSPACVSHILYSLSEVELTILAGTQR